MRSNFIVGSALTLILIVLIPIGVSFGDHGDPWLVAFPDPTEGLPTNGRITLFAENGPHPYVVDYKQNSYRLLSGTEVVKLRVNSAWQGLDWDGYGRSNIVLVPRSKLKAGKTYRLEVKTKGGQWDPAHTAAVMTESTATYGGPSGGAQWTVSKAPDRTAPRWAGALKLVSDKGIVNVKAKIADSTPVSFRVLATLIKGGKTTKHYTYHQELFGILDGCVYIPIDGYRKYHLSLTPIDTAGNKGKRRAIPVDATKFDNVNVCLERI